MSTTISGVDRSVCKDYSSQPRGFLTPPAVWKTRRCSPRVRPASEKIPRRSNSVRGDIFHIIHKVPSGDSPYVRAKHVQLIDKDPGRAVSLFWSAINAGDRVDSALKDMAVVMKQLDRSDEAIEAIKSFRHICPPESQESLDNILVELYKQSGRIGEEIEMLQVKLKQVESGIAFGGKRTKIARSQGKKVQITVEKEYSRLLGNLAWAYLQQKDFKSAEEHYRKALSFEPDKNKQCNLAICLMHMNKITEAKFLLQTIKVLSQNGQVDESYAKSYERAAELLAELESQHVNKLPMKQTESNDECGVAIASGGQRGNTLCFQKSCTDKNGVLPSPPLPCFIKKKNNEAFSGYPSEKRTDVDWGTNHYQSNISQESYTACKKPYESPFCNGFIPKAPSTQPQCSQYGDQRKGDGYGSSCRKLSFESSTDNGNAQTLVNQNDNYCSGAPNEVSEVMPQFSERQYPSMTGDYRTKNSADNSLDKTRPDEERINSFTYYSKEYAAEECKLPSDLVFYDDLEKTEEIYNGDSGNCCKFCAMSGLTDACAVENLTKQRKAGSPCGPKKSWADMVEEEDNEQEDKPWRCEFNDENVDFNIISETPKAIDQAEKFSQKMELMDLEGGGYHTQPARKPISVRRSLCFDQNCNQDMAKVLNFEDQALVLSEDLSSTKPVKWWNRLQVFHEITQVQESRTVS